jgi:hypothetical protein
MGLSIYTYVDCHAIDDERWEAVYLTSLQLLEQFPGPLARRIHEDVGRFQRLVVTKNIVRGVDSPEERWEVDRELGSGRSAEPFVLYRHLDYYRKRIEYFRGKPRETTGDILRPPVRGDGKEPEWYDVGGYEVFNSKTQGYPYHYAVLAVGMLLESSFPRHALVRGDITRRQAEQTAEWATAVLGRRMALPVIVDGPRLWKRLIEAFPASDPLDTIQRFRMLLVGDDEAALRALDEGHADPQAVRRVYLQELDRYHTLNQHGAQALIRAVCNADGDLARAIDWVCGPRDAATEQDPDKQSTTGRFQPEELLKALCDSFITVPLYEREVLQSFRLPPDSLTNIEEMIGQILLMMSGMPTAVDWYLDEEQLLAEFVRRWPEREQELAHVLRESLEKVDRLREQLRQVSERLEELADELSDKEAVWEASAEGQDFQPAAEFIHAEILRQHENVADLEDAVRELGQQLQPALRKNDELRKSLEGSDRRRTLDQLYHASFENGIALPEEIWQEIDRLRDLEVLHVLLLLMMCPEREIGFWRSRQRLLESPDLWPLLTGRTP